MQPTLSSARPAATARFNARWISALYRKRNPIERFNKLKHFRRIATRYDKPPTR